MTQIQLKELIKDLEKELKDLQEIKDKNRKYSFHWSFAEGAIGATEYVLSRLKAYDR